MRCPVIPVCVALICSPASTLHPVAGIHPWAVHTYQLLLLLPRLPVSALEPWTSGCFLLPVTSDAAAREPQACPCKDSCEDLWEAPLGAELWGQRAGCT